ncbi:MerR family transcriptional regulator [Spirillospora sp. NPDC052269]
MFTIGEFARHGRVSIRMLRHYDALGLLRPVRVDPDSGYRYYEAGQLARLNRVIALKDLGFTLQQVRDILNDQVTTEELRAMLRLRRAELETAMTTTAARLVQVEARLRSIEREGQMPDEDIAVKSLPKLRVAEVSGVTTGFDAITPVIQPLYGELFQLLEKAGITPSGPGVAYYEDAPDGGVLIHAGVEVTAPVMDGDRLRIVDLPPIERAATVLHRGSPAAMLPAVQTLGRWIEANGYRSTGYPREISLECPENQDDWLTEIQEPVTPA